MKLLIMLSLKSLMLSLFSLSVSAEGWSRQLSTDLIENSDQINEWIPLTSKNKNYDQFLKQTPFEISSKLAPEMVEITTASSAVLSSSTSNIDRTGSGRVLSYPNNVFGGVNLQSAASQQNLALYNYVNPNPQSQTQSGQKFPPVQKQQPTSQSFFKFEMPTFSFDGRMHSQPIQTGYKIEHSFGPAPTHTVITSPFNQQKPFDYHSQGRHIAQHQQRKHNSETQTKDSKTSTTANHENLVAHRPDFFANSPQMFQKPTSFQPQFQNIYKQQESLENFFTSQEPAPVKPKEEDDVQLLYVPYDTLYNQQNENQLVFNNGKYNLAQQPVNPLQINNFYTKDPLDNHHGSNFGLSSSTTTTTTTTQRTTTSSLPYRSNTNSNQFLNPKFTTPKSKPKPHQPPLAIFLHKTSMRATPYDVVNILNQNRVVAVLDSPSKNSPEVFIGPSGLQTPSGYIKFELPYLSSFNQNNLDGVLKATPFFVAPLSYKTPFGFSKILLPEPHVGSIIINKPFQTEDNLYSRESSTRIPHRPHTTNEIYTKSLYVSTTPFNNFQTTTLKQINRFQSTTPHEVLLYKQQLPKDKSQVSHDQNDYFNRFYQDSQREFLLPKQIKKQQPSRTRLTGEPTSIQTVGTKPVEKLREHEFTQDIRSMMSKKPAEPTFVERGKPIPVESTFTQTAKPYVHFKPMPNNIGKDDYFREDLPETTPISHSLKISTTAAKPTVTTTPEPFYSETFEQDRYSANHSQQYFEGVSSKPAQNSKVLKHKYHSKPLFDDEYQMKVHFRQQNANQNRQPTAPDTTIKPKFESINHTPVSLRYDRPPSIQSYYEGSTLRTTTQKVAFFTPRTTSYEKSEQKNVFDVQSQSINKFNQQQKHEQEQETLTPYFTQTTIATYIPNNSYPNYANEINVNNYDEPKSEENEYEKMYNLSSEIPPLTPNLPGLVNALKENERLNAIEKEKMDNVTTTTTTTTTSARIRRPINRGRRPASRTTTSSSLSPFSLDENITRIPLSRTRRPYSPTSNITMSTIVSSTSSVSSGDTTRNSIRNPNRVRYNPTNEERKQFRSKTRKQSVINGKINKEAKNDLEYQRDVLKQNYPIFKHPTRKSFFTTTSDKPKDVMTVTPSALGEGFSGLLEPMQIAQQYQHQQYQDNYGPGYFPNEEEINPTEQIQNEITSTVPPTHLSPLTTTSESIRDLSKNPAFKRRSRPSKTITEAYIITTSEANEKFTVRPRRPVSSTPRKVIKIRTRTRRPHPVSTTTAEPNHENDNIHKVNKFNQDFYSDNYKNNDAAYNRKFVSRQKYNLDTQETKWSPAVSKKENFKPINSKQTEILVNYDNGQDIVTVSPDNLNTKKEKNTFEFNVSAGFGPSIQTYGSEIKSANSSSKSNRKKLVEKTIEPTFEELLEQVMTDLGREVAAKKEAKAAASEASKINNEESSRQLKSPANDRVNHTHRRGVWKKVRVTQTSSSSSSLPSGSDTFEIAESQNIGAQLINTIYNKQKLQRENLEISGETVQTSKIDKSLTNKTYSTEITFTTPSVTTQEIGTSTTTSTKTSTSTYENLNNADVITPSLQQLYSEIQPFDLISATSSTSKPVNKSDGTTTRFFNQDYEEDDNIGDVISRRFDEQHQAKTDKNEPINDLESQSSLFDEVRSQLKNLFAVHEEDDYNVAVKPNYLTRKNEYTTIRRVRPSPTLATETEKQILDQQNSIEVTTSKDTLFHKNLMKNVIYATSTSKEVSQETEICYRGQCVKSVRA